MEESKRKIRIGDRFYWENSSVWEVTHINDSNTAKILCVESNHREYPLGSINDEYPIRILLEPKHRSWKYLGNFSKVNHFEQLYNLLNSSL